MVEAVAGPWSLQYNPVGILNFGQNQFDIIVFKNINSVDMHFLIVKFALIHDPHRALPP